MAELFDLCVGAMYLMSDITGLTYKEINIWLFVIIHPVITLTLFILLIFKQRKINHFQKTSEDLDFEMSLQDEYQDEDEDVDDITFLEGMQAEAETKAEYREIERLIQKLSKSLNSLSAEEFEKILKSDPLSK